MLRFCMLRFCMLRFCMLRFCMLRFCMLRFCMLRFCVRCRTCRPLMSSCSSRTSIICHSCKLASLKQCTRWQKLVQSEQRNPCCVCCYDTWPEARYTIHLGMIPVTYQEFIPYSLARRAFPPPRYKQEHRFIYWMNRLFPDGFRFWQNPLLTMTHSRRYSWENV